MYHQSALPPPCVRCTPVSHLICGSTNSNLVSSLLIRKSRWNRELCVDRDHFVLKFFMQMKHSCSLLWISECRDAMWRRSAFIDCRRRLQKLQINEATAPTTQSSLGAPTKKKKQRVARIWINHVLDSWRRKQMKRMGTIKLEIRIVIGFYYIYIYIYVCIRFDLKSFPIVFFSF